MLCPRRHPSCPCSTLSRGVLASARWGMGNGSARSIAKIRLRRGIITPGPGCSPSRRGRCCPRAGARGSPRLAGPLHPTTPLLSAPFGCQALPQQPDDPISTCARASRVTRVESRVGAMRRAGQNHLIRACAVKRAGSQDCSGRPVCIHLFLVFPLSFSVDQVLASKMRCNTRIVQPAHR